MSVHASEPGLSRPRLRGTALTVLLLAVAASGARPPEAVEALRQALSSPTTGAERAGEVGRQVAALPTLGDLRRALVLSEWRDQHADTAVARLDASLRQKVATRFTATVRTALAQSEPGQRAALAELLGMMGATVDPADPAAAVLRGFTADLARLTQDEAPEVRQAAALALGQTHADLAVALPALAAVLAGKDEGARVAAAEALRAIVHGLSVKRKATQSALEVLLASGDALAACRAVAPVAGLGLKDSLAVVRGPCLESLARAADHAGQLVDFLKSANDVDFSDDYRRKLDARARELRPLLEALGRELPGLTAALADADRGLRLRAARALEDLAGARRRWLQMPPAVAHPDPMAAGLRAAQPALVRALAHADAEVRLGVVEVIEIVGPESAGAVAALIRAAGDDDRFVRWSAVRTLGRLPGPSGPDVTAALTARLEDADTDVRLAALTALERVAGQIDRALLLPALARLLESQDRAPRVGAVRLLRSVGRCPEAVAVLRPLLTDPDEGLRKEAALALGALDHASAETRAALRDLLQDDSAEVRQAAREAMLGSPGKQ